MMPTDEVTFRTVVDWRSWLLAAVNSPRRGCPRAWRQAVFVGLENLMLVETLSRSGLLARQCSYAIEASRAVRGMVIRKAHYVEMFLQECPEALDGEHGRLVRRRLSSDIDTDEQCSILIQHSPDLLHGNRRVGHVIESLILE